MAFDGFTFYKTEQLYHRQTLAQHRNQTSAAEYSSQEFIYLDRTISLYSRAKIIDYRKTDKRERGRKDVFMNAQMVGTLSLSRSYLVA